MTPTDPIYPARLRQLADRLEREQRGNQRPWFDLRFWREGHPCGTTHCGMGIAVDEFPGLLCWQDGSPTSTVSKRQGLEAAREVFGLAWIFAPSHYNRCYYTDPTEMIRRLRETADKMDRGEEV